MPLTQTVRKKGFSMIDKKNLSADQLGRLERFANFITVQSVSCGNCGTFRTVGQDFIVEKCSNCGDDEYDMLETQEVFMSDTPFFLTPLAVDCAYCHCSTAIVRDGVHCVNCGLVYKSHSH